MHVGGTSRVCSRGLSNSSHRRAVTLQEDLPRKVMFIAHLCERLGR